MHPAPRLAALVLAAVLAGCAHGPALTGQVRGPLGSVTDARVRVLDASEHEVELARTDGAGRFRIRGKLEPRPYTIEVLADGYQPLRTTVQVSGDASVELALTPQATVRGTVRFADESVASGASIRFFRGPDVVHGVTAGPDGAYTATGLDPGEYTVRAESDNGEYVQSLPRQRIEGSEAVIDLRLEHARTHVEAPVTDVRQPGPVIDVDVPVAQ